jgi:hypothetical protein
MSFHLPSLFNAIQTRLFPAIEDAVGTLTKKGQLQSQRQLRRIDGQSERSKKVMAHLMYSSRHKSPFVNQKRPFPRKTWYSWGFEPTKHVEQW